MAPAVWLRTASPLALWPGRGRSGCQRFLTKWRCPRLPSWPTPLPDADTVGELRVLTHPLHPLQRGRNPNLPFGTQLCSEQPWLVPPLPPLRTVPHAPLMRQRSAVGVRRLHRRPKGVARQPGGGGPPGGHGSLGWPAPARGPNPLVEKAQTGGHAGGYGVCKYHCSGN